MRMLNGEPKLEYSDSDSFDFFSGFLVFAMYDIMLGMSSVLFYCERGNGVRQPGPVGFFFLLADPLLATP